MSYKIRRTENIDLVKGLFRAVFPADEFDGKWSNAFWLVWYNDCPVGFCGIRPVSTDKNTAFLSIAGLLPGHRGNGLHIKMIRVRVRWAIKNGYSHIITYTHKDNPTSFSNLQRSKFKLYLPEYKYAGESFLYWIREL